MMRTMGLAAVMAAAAGGARAQDIYIPLPPEPRIMNHTPCVVLEVASIDNRMHARFDCPGVLPPRYMAIDSVTQPGHAAATAAMLMPHLDRLTVFEVWWDDNPHNNPPGCLVEDCRRLVAVVHRTRP